MVSPLQGTQNEPLASQARIVQFAFKAADLCTIDLARKGSGGGALNMSREDAGFSVDV